MKNYARINVSTVTNAENGDKFKDIDTGINGAILEDKLIDETGIYASFINLKKDGTLGNTYFTYSYSFITNRTRFSKTHRR